MIDVKDIYDQVMEDAALRNVTANTAPTADGARISRECYSHKEPAWALDALKQGLPISLDDPLKHVRTAKFVPPEKLLEIPPKPDGFAPFEIGGGVKVPVDCSKPLRLYEGGVASIQLQMTGEYCEAVINFQDALQGLPDFEQETKAAKAAGEKKYREENPFDADEVFSVSRVDKDTRIKNRDDAIRKKKSRWEQNAAKARQRAADDVVRSRNDRLTASGLSDEAARLALNGSLDLESGTLYWYPTTLDLVRMCKLTFKIPTRFFLDVDSHDDVAPEPDPEFSRSLLAEAFDTALRGKDVFNDIRDSWHNKPGRRELGPFPLVKPTRWNGMLKRFNAAKRPLTPRDSFRTFRNDDNTVWEGSTGMVAMRLKTVTDNRYNILTIDGVRVVYARPSGETPVTAYFMTPHSLASVLRDAEQRPEKISLVLIKRTFMNMKDLQAEASAMFGQKGGTRRYIA